MSMGSGGIFGRPVGIQYGDLLDEGMGAPVDNPAFRQPMPGAPLAPKAKQGGGFFGEGGTGRAIAGSLGDALMQMGGMRPIYGPTMQQRRQQAYEQQQREAQRAQEWDDFTRQYDYKRANPTAAAPDVFTRTLMAAGIDPASDQGRALYKQRATTMASPPMMIGPDGLPYAKAPVSSVPEGYDPEEWEPVDGPSQQGGPTPPASGGFR